MSPVTRLAAFRCSADRRHESPFSRKVTERVLSHASRRSEGTELADARDLGTSPRPRAFKVVLRVGGLRRLLLRPLPDDLLHLRELIGGLIGGMNGGSDVN